jgi:hypothetical protein
MRRGHPNSSPREKSLVVLATRARHGTGIGPLLAEGFGELSQSPRGGTEVIF